MGVVAEYGSRRPLNHGALATLTDRKGRGGGSPHRDERSLPVRRAGTVASRVQIPPLPLVSVKPSRSSVGRDGTVAPDAGPKRCCLTTMEPNSELRGISVGQTDKNGRRGIGFDSRRVLEQRRGDHA